MNARSLVGMSQRRRKEMFHVEFEAAREKDGTVSMFVADALLSRYRIGQRLRPCPGCAECAYITWIGGRPVRNADQICNGSGVLPAKKAKVK